MAPGGRAAAAETDRREGPMPSFDPTRAPIGRLTRLGVVLDGSSPASRLVALARMCERAGIDAVWFADRTEPSVDSLVLAEQIEADLDRAHLGLLVDPERRSPRKLAVGLARLVGSTRAPVEVTIDEGSGSVAEYVEALSVELSAGAEPRPRIAAVAGTVDGIGRLLATVDDVVLPGLAIMPISRRRPTRRELPRSTSGATRPAWGSPRCCRSRSAGRGPRRPPGRTSTRTLPSTVIRRTSASSGHSRSARIG